MSERNDLPDLDGGQATPEQLPGASGKEASLQEASLPDGSPQDDALPEAPPEGASKKASPKDTSLRKVLAKLWVLVKEEAVAFLVLGLLALIAGATWYAIGRNVDGWVRGLLFGGAASLAVYALLRPGDLRRAFSGRTVRYGSNALILSVAAVGIVVLLNYLSNRYYKRLDLTESSLHTLSPQSIEILKALDGEIEVIGAYPGGQGQETFERWLDEYGAHTDKLRYSTFDPIRQPGEAEQLGWNSYGGGLIVRRGTRSEQVRGATEQEITSALLKVSRDSPLVVYFMTGHGEPSPTDYEETGYGKLGTLLADNNYQARTLNLAITDTVPADAAVVVAAGLQTPLLEEEKERLNLYLLKNGRMLMLVDPGVETGMNDVLAPWGARFEDKLVVDLSRSLSGDPITLAIHQDQYQPSQVTRDLPTTYLPVARPILAGAPLIQGATLTPLGVTSRQSWADANTEAGQELRLDDEGDLVGPHMVMASIEAAGSASGEETRMVLVGDSDFVANQVLSGIPNGQFLFLNALNWLAEEKPLVVIGDKNVPRNIRMTMIEEGVVCFGSLILIPALIALAGAVVWFRQR